MEMLDEEEHRAVDKLLFQVSPSATVLNEHSYSKAVPFFEPTPPQSPGDSFMEEDPLGFYAICCFISQ